MNINLFKQINESLQVDQVSKATRVNGIKEMIWVRMVSMEILTSGIMTVTDVDRMGGEEIAETIVTKITTEVGQGTVATMKMSLKKEWTQMTVNSFKTTETIFRIVEAIEIDDLLIGMTPRGADSIEIMIVVVLATGTMTIVAMATGITVTMWVLVIVITMTNIVTRTIGLMTETGTVDLDQGETTGQTVLIEDVVGVEVAGGTEGVGADRIGSNHCIIFIV